MAIEDSMCLAECLSREKSTSDIPKALKMSEAIGKPRTKLVTQSLAFCCFTHLPDLPCHSPFPASTVRPTGPNTLQSPHSIQLPASWHRAFQAGGRGINWKAPVQTGVLLIAGAGPRSDTTSTISTLIQKKYLQMNRGAISRVNNGSYDIGTPLHSYPKRA